MVTQLPPLKHTGSPGTVQTAALQDGSASDRTVREDEGEEEEEEETLIKDWQAHVHTDTHNFIRYTLLRHQPLIGCFFSTRAATLHKVELLLLAKNTRLPAAFLRVDACEV